VWDAQTGRAMTAPLKHGDYLWAAEFSPDGEQVVTASQDKTARVWDAETGLPLTEPLKHNSAVLSAHFSPDGERIVTISANGTAHVWDVAPPRGRYPDWLPQLAEAISGAALNKQGVLQLTRLNRAEIIRKIRQRLNDAPLSDDWIVWGRWFLADPSTRTISPFSKIAVPEYTEDRIKENTAESLEEVEHLASGNIALLQRISEARRAAEQTARREPGN